MEESPARWGVSAPIKAELPATVVVPEFAAGWVGASVSAPDPPGAVVSADALPVGTRMPMVPSEPNTHPTALCRKAATFCGARDWKSSIPSFTDFFTFSGKRI